MKRSFNIVFLSISILFLSCSKDDDLQSNSIVGKWETIADYSFCNNQWVLDESYEKGEEIVVFTEDGYTYSIINGVKENQMFPYTFDAKNMKLTAFIVFDVDFEDNKLIMFHYFSFDNCEKFKTIFERVNE